MKQCITFIFACLLALVASQSSYAKHVDFYFYDSEINGLSDVTLPGRLVSLYVDFSIGDGTTIDKGKVTLTLPEEFTFHGTWTWSRGDVTDVEISERTAVINLQRSGGTSEGSFNIRLPVQTAKLTELPTIAEFTEINAAIDVLGTNGTNYTAQEAWPTILLYSKGTVSVSKDGTSLKAEEEFTINVSVEPFPFLEMYYSRVSVNVPYLTSLVPGSVSGLGGDSSTSGQVYAEYPSGGARSFNFSFRVKVWDQTQLDYFGETDISLYTPNVNLRVRTPFTGNPNDPTRTFHRRIFSASFNSIDPIPLFVPPNEIIVNSTGDQPLDPTKEGCTTGGTIANGDPECTLRAAIQAVNLGRGERIEFNIPGEDIPTIPLLSALPAITVPIEIDGTTQTAGRIEVRGNGGEFNGLDLQGGNSLVKGLVLNGFLGLNNAAIKISNTGGNQILGNFIGTDKTAEAAVVTTNGVIIDGASNNQIGGPDEEDQNVIAAAAGIELIKSESATNSPNANKILNNRIGLTPAGEFLETSIGIFLIAGNDNQIGGQDAGNIIATIEVGIAVIAQDPIKSVLIEDNEVGLDSTGNARESSSLGIYVDASFDADVDGITITNNKAAGSTANILVQGHRLKKGTITGNRIGLQFGDTQQRPPNLAERSQLYGLYDSGVSDITVSNNTIAGHEWNLLVAGASQTEISNGVVSFGGPFNPYELEEGVAAGKDIRITNNRIGINDSNQIPANSVYYCGVAVFAGADEVVIENNTIAKHDNELPRSSIYLVDGKKHRVSGNVIGTTAGTNVGSSVGLSILNATQVKVGAYDGGAGNVIGNHRIGILISGDATSLEFKQNTVGTDATGASSLGNTIGMLIDKTGKPPEGAPSILLEENTIAGNSTFGLKTTTAYQVKLVENYIGLTPQFQRLPNLTGIDIGSSPIVAEENVIAYNTDNGILSSGEGFLYLTKNRIYENGDDSDQNGIVILVPTVTPPRAVAAVRSEPDFEGNVSILLVVAKPDTEEPVTFEFFTDLDREHPQGRSFLFERESVGNEIYLEELKVPQTHPLATAKTLTVTKTVNGETSAFSTKSLVETYQLPQLEFFPSSSTELRIGWLKSDLFKLQEGIPPEGPFYDSEAVPVVDGNYYIVTVNLLDGDQFFRLILDPKSLVSP